MRVGIDIGGTFTDLVASDGGSLRVAKVPSTPDDPARAFREVLDDAGEAEEIRHGTTVATNAVLTRTGAELLFLSTEGFRHLLHIARQDRPSLYDLRARRPEPLVGRDRCLGVPERTGPHGETVRPLDADALREAVRPWRGRVDGVAVCLLHAYADPKHERAAADVVRDELGVDVSCSSDVLPEFREYERASTTVLNAYVRPVVERYLGRLPGPRVGVMWSGGGVRSVERTAALPVHTLLSGPAAGVLGAAHAARAAGFPDVVTLDMGGTSADVSIVEDGRPLAAEESSLDGLPFRTPCLDVVSVGAGGGSIAWIDSGGALRVGPRSAGADPGPACYGRGGTHPTVTDAHVVLGHLGDGGLAGGALDLDRAAAEAAVARLGERAGLGPRECAEGILRVVRATMARAIRAVSIERGKDVRRYALVAFGGAGGLHAVALARELGIRTVLFPPAAGALAAYGLLVASRRAEASVTRPMGAERPADGALRSVLHELTEQALAELADEGIGFPETRIELAVECRYAGQSHELRVPVEGPPSFDRIGEAFHAAHEERYGFARPGAAVEAVTFRAVAWGPPGEIEAEPPSGRSPLEGPATVTEPDATLRLEPGSRAEVHGSGCLVVTP